MLDAIISTEGASGRCGSEQAMRVSKAMVCEVLEKLVRLLRWTCAETDCLYSEYLTFKRELQTSHKWTQPRVFAVPLQSDCLDTTAAVCHTLLNSEPKFSSKSAPNLFQTCLNATPYLTTASRFRERSAARHATYNQNRLAGLRLLSSRCPPTASSRRYRPSTSVRTY